MQARQHASLLLAFTMCAILCFGTESAYANGTFSDFYKSSALSENTYTVEQTAYRIHATKANDLTLYVGDNEGRLPTTTKAEVEQIGKRTKNLWVRSYILPRKSATS
ncbi:hypothetical protein QO008_001566 [Peptoniphilus ivorii]|uniref:hypothetical protein n=1 Tax=Aedoeadaptatus ivorii TaxID=54006 RepID=UPI000F84BBC0|nr:hypothetical protein [Peptoniphilus ivorii]MDQ0509082.1 hypothetical protein [Peptoniphilus ivorii]